MNQNRRVLQHLINHGYITQTIASNYGIRRLASRVHDLKLAGIEVDVQRRVDDAGVPYAYYSLPLQQRYATETASLLEKVA